MCAFFRSQLLYLLLSLSYCPAKLTLSKFSVIYCLLTLRGTLGNGFGTNGVGEVVRVGGSEVKCNGEAGVGCRVNGETDGDSVGVSGRDASDLVRKADDDPFNVIPSAEDLRPPI